MARITKRFVDGLGGEDIGRIIRDDELPGFGVRRNADGSATYLVEYRAGRGRGFPTRRLSLGRHGALTPEQARNEAKQVLARVARGEDPAAARSARKKEPTIRDVLLLALDQHWKPKRKPSTAKVFGEMVHRTLIPEFGTVRLAELTRAQVRAWHAKQGHRPRAANHELAVLRKALSLAIGEGLLKGENPAKGIALHPENARDRVPTDDELRAVWRAIDETPVRPATRLLFKLLALTGCRREEWLSARWENIDLGRAIYRLLEGKAGGRTIPLSGPVLALLKAETRRSSWVVPNDTGSGPLTPDMARGAWEAVRDAAGVRDLRLHDLRHAFATRGASLGANALVLRDALGHKTLAMTSRYVARQADPVREISERIGNSMLTVVGQDQVVREGVDKHPDPVPAHTPFYADPLKHARAATAAAMEGKRTTPAAHRRRSK